MRTSRIALRFVENLIGVSHQFDMGTDGIADRLNRAMSPSGRRTEPHLHGLEKQWAMVRFASATSRRSMTTAKAPLSIEPARRLCSQSNRYSGGRVACREHPRVAPSIDGDAGQWHAHWGRAKFDVLSMRAPRNPRDGRRHVRHQIGKFNRKYGRRTLCAAAVEVKMRSHR